MVTAIGDAGERRDGPRNLRAAVDRTACCGYALCVEICPDMYELGDDNVVHIIQATIPDELMERVRRAVELCPQSALSIEEGDF